MSLTVRIRKQMGDFSLETDFTAQQGKGFVFGVKPHVQLKIAQFLADVYKKCHQRPPPFSRFSSRFTASRNTAERAMFTSTHFSAPASSLMRQSW